MASIIKDFRSDTLERQCHARFQGPHPLDAEFNVGLVLIALLEVKTWQITTVVGPRCRTVSFVLLGRSKLHARTGK